MKFYGETRLAVTPTVEYWIQNGPKNPEETFWYSTVVYTAVPRNNIISKLARPAFYTMTPAALPMPQQRSSIRALSTTVDGAGAEE